MLVAAYISSQEIVVPAVKIVVLRFSIASLLKHADELLETCLVYILDPCNTISLQQLF